MLKPVVVRTRVSNEDFIMRDHRVHQVRILPGVTYLDLILRALADESWDTKQLEFRNIVFQEALATSEAFDKEVRITVSPIDPHGTVVVESRKVKGQDVLDEGWGTNLRCEVHYVPTSESKRLDVRRLKEQASRMTDMDEAYSFTRRMQIEHYTFMKGLGSVYEHDEYKLAELKLSTLAAQYAPYFRLHPAYLDSSTLVPGLFYFRDAGLLREEDFNKPFIPLVIESFRAWGGLGGEGCYVYVPRSSVSLSANDLLYSDIELYNEDGVQVAVFNRLVIKKIRSASYMQQLQDNAAEAEDGLTSGPEAKIEETHDAATKIGTAAEHEGADELEMEWSLADQLRSLIGRVLGRSADTIRVDEGFYEQGMDSGDLLRLVRLLEERLQVQLYPTLLFEYPTVASLADYLYTEYGTRQIMLERDNRQPGDQSVPAAATGRHEVPAAISATIPVEQGIVVQDTQKVQDVRAIPLLCTYDWVAEKLPEPAVRTSAGQSCCLLLAADRNSLVEMAAAKDALGGADMPVILVKAGTRFHIQGEDEYEIDPGNEEHYSRLIQELAKRDQRADRMVHMWSWNGGAAEAGTLEQQLVTGIYSIHHVTKAFMAIKQPVKLISLVPVFGDGPEPAAAALGGYAKSVALEDPRFQYASIELADHCMKEWPLYVLRELNALTRGGEAIRYEGGIRYVRRMVRSDNRTAHLVPFRPAGVYIITGGIGGLGWLIATRLASACQARVVLIGRSAPPADWPSKLQQLRMLGGDACYVQADLSDAAETSRAVATAESVYGAINGVIHCAGVLRDSLAAAKPVGDMAEVFAPKLYGTQNLDSALLGKPLDLFVLFSSLSAVAGNIGQSDYAYANAYMDFFAMRRNRQAARGERSGRAVSFNWPLWRSGGMQVDRSTEDAIRHSYGFIPLETKDGLDLFEHVLGTSLEQAVALCGDEERMISRLDIRLPQHAGTMPPAGGPSIDSLAEEPIAVIGVSGRYPMADDVEQYWDNLKNGRDCITEIPEDRWDYRSYYDPEPGRAGRTYSKWGGFLRDVDKFDSLFFNITPHEARIMDPQERLFLETVWHLMEDAGYSRSAVSGKKIGVYTGVMWGHYQMLGDGQEGKTQYPSSIYASISNRVSYFYNFQGPSMALDTMCSSSITAVHLACDSIRKGECVMAIAGGVNVTVHPDKYLYLSEHRFTSSDGRCRSFGDGGDGYVPGEGVGAILLKPLRQAEADGDYIYGVIRASSINHGGKTSGYSVPSPSAQRNLIAETLSKAEIDARTISYIEAHGTGTSLGDPIEISGLSQAFAPYNPAVGSCPVGSAKSNIGHLESAAGIAGITKVLLQLKHKQLAPSLHSEQLNGAIPFGATPFYVQQTLSEWKRPVTVTDGITEHHPRKAGISTFGAGGSNAHIIIEEYERAAAKLNGTGGPVLLVLSAKDRARLKQYAGRISAWLIRQSEADREHGMDSIYSLDNIAYTLQVGREPMEDRLAVWTADIREAAAALDRFSKEADGGVQMQGLYTSGAARPLHVHADPVVVELLESWIGGSSTDWSRLYAHRSGRPQRVPVPGYPFAKVRHWIQRIGEHRASSAAHGSARFDVLHPLVHRNTSDLNVQKYTSVLAPESFYIADHRVLGELVMPGAAILEMARAAGVLGANAAIRTLEQVVWQEPLRIGQAPLETHIGLYMNGEDVEFEVFTEPVLDGDKTVHGYGTIKLNPSELTTLSIPVEQWRQRCPEQLSSQEAYERLLARGIEYGAAMQAIASIHIGTDEAVARLELPSAVPMADADSYWLHPALADGAIQAVIGLMADNGVSSVHYLPFYVEQVNFYEKLEPVCWAMVTRLDGAEEGSAFQSFDITVTDEHGRVLLQLQRLTVKRVEDGVTASDDLDPLELTAPQATVTPAEGQRDEETYAEKLLLEMMSEETEIPIPSIKSSEPLDKYGIDSVMVLSLTAKLERQFGPLSKTLLFEYRTIASLASYLARKHAGTVRALMGHGERQQVQSAAHSVKQKPQPNPAKPPARLPRPMREERLAYSRNEGAAEPVAIIGLAGRYPKARNVEQFWHNLRSGLDCITEIPPDRWDHSKWLGNSDNKSGVYSKWGGFIDDVDKFDPLFFQISPREAEKMDPQERLFLEVAWETLEDAAYTRTRLAGESVGVFVGAMYGHYQLFGAEALAEGMLADVNSSFASIANRVSYTFDWRGPSLTVDTMCSSSLYSVHLACESIRRGECSMALAGGVNVTIHPSKYVLLSEGKFASTEGRCRSFGEGGDGYVPGEGAGALLLKPLSQAVADGDRIYGVIRGSAVNHGGRTNGYTVPNPTAQSDVITAALARSGVHPETIRYIEAHGTGTSLGDPIEIGGLTQAFGAYTQSTQYCSIGSVKSNIGHLESAAGIAALTKVLLQMKHGELVPSLHAETINAHIDFGATPFYVQRQLEPWPRMHAADDSRFGAARQLPRRAGVSSFGAGGANAHLIVEEYVQEDTQSLSDAEENEMYLVPLSASDEERLAEYARKLADDLANRLEGTDRHRYTLPAIASTLQLGREAMSARLAICVRSVRELLDELRLFSQGRSGQWLAGNTESGMGMMERFLEGPEWEQFANYLINGRSWRKLGLAWVAGAVVDWRLLHAGGLSPMKTVSLATYPFARERYWLDKAGAQAVVAEGNVLHPLLDRNESSFDEISFCKTFRGNEFYVDGHRFHGSRTLPGAVYVAMAQAAYELAARESTEALRLERIEWHRPFKLGEQERTLRISLVPEEDGVRFEAYGDTAESGARIVYCSGLLVEASQEDEVLDLKAIRGRCHASDWLSGDAFYQLFAQAGLQYGRAMRPVQEVWRSGGEALARLKQGEGSVKGAGFKLHPALLDGALQAAAAALDLKGSVGTRLPYSVDSIDIAGPLPEMCYAYVTEHHSGTESIQGDYQCTIVLADQEGRMVVRLKGVVFRPMQQSSIDSGVKESELELADPLFFHPVWNRAELEQGQPKPGSEPTLLLAASSFEQHGRAAFEGAVIAVSGASFQPQGDNRYEIDPAEPGSCRLLLEHLKQQGAMPRRIVYLAAQRDESDDDGGSIYTLFNLCKAYLEMKSSEPLQLVYAYVSRDGYTSPHHAAVSGFMHSLHKENPSIRCTTVEWKEEGAAISEATAMLLTAIRKELDAKQEGVREVRYEGGSRYVRTVVECEPELFGLGSAQPTIKADGVYVITGGMGGLGLIFAEYLARTAPVKLVLAGRSEPDQARLSGLAERFRVYGSDALYVQADVTNRDDVRRLIRTAKEAYGRIDGIIHSSGVLRDSFLLFKTRQQFEEVLAPKLNGTKYLDEETRGEQLDFFVLCSSISALYGNVGQCDYAYANRYMDAYAEMRSHQVRHGKTLSVNWPLWAEGGMKVDVRLEQMLEQSMGVRPLSSEAGIRTLERGLGSGLTQLLPLQGAPDRIRASILGDAAVKKAAIVRFESVTTVRATELNHTELAEAAQRYLTTLLASIIKLPAGRIHVRTPLESYGIDSVMVVRMNEKLEQSFGPLPKTLLYEYQSIAELAAYLAEHHKERVSSRLMAPVALDGGRKQAVMQTAAASEVNVTSSATTAAVPVKASSSRPRYAPLHSAKRNEQKRAVTDIAIIGLDGKYPKASTLEQFWSNLAEGRDCVTEIPSERWSVTPEFYDPDKGRTGTSYSKWGGFIDEADRFDPLFFGISPKDAKGIDPQERLFLESVWRTVENAGYTRSSLSRYKVGVFTGVMYGHYQLFAAEEHLKGNPVTAASSFASIANRVSHFFNFKGPSLALDTMCSSSLTAIHLACESIRRGESQLAIAGGVNLSIHPNKYVLLSRGTFVSSDGRCRSFGEGGDGYVPGEGVGAVLLKPLEQAEADGDRIYGVIKATAINHGGRTNGYTVPSPAAQGEVIAEALAQSGIDPRSISYIEAHGTGTPLGDPIEIAGLSKAFETYTPDKGFCSIGSLKSNIGHLESAAGIAGLTKLLLQMQHRKLVPSLHSGTLNPNINFADTPFYVQRSLEEWVQPVVAVNGKQVQYPRRAGISSFGAGGSNAHLIVEEYTGSSGRSDRHVSAHTQEALIVMSARNDDRLRHAAKQLASYLKNNMVRNDRVVQAEGSSLADASELTAELAELIAAATGVPAEAIDRGEPLSTYLQDSHQAGAFADSIQARTYSEIAAIELVECGSLNELAEKLESKMKRNTADAELLQMEQLAATKEARTIDVRDLAYTLQAGREAMSERLAFAAADLETVVRVLELYADTAQIAEGMYKGRVNDAAETAWSILDSAEGDLFVRQLIANKQLDKLAKLWTSGVQIDWEPLYDGASPRRIPLPTYPFARERYWVDTVESRQVRAIGSETILPVRETATIDILWRVWDGGSTEDAIQQLLGERHE